MLPVVARASPAGGSLDRRDRVGVGGGLVGPVALHAREAEREAARILRTRLHVVERDLGDDFRPNVDGVRVAPNLELEKLRRLPPSISSVSPLNVLPSMTKPPRSPSRAPRCRLLSVPVRRPLPHSAARMTRSSVCACYLQPRRAATPGRVAGVERLGHHAFMARRERAGGECGRFIGAGGHDRERD